MNIHNEIFSTKLNLHELAKSVIDPIKKGKIHDDIEKLDDIYNPFIRLRNYIMSIPTVYSCSEENNYGVQMHHEITIESELPVSDEDIRIMEELMPIMYTYNIKNKYKDGEKIFKIS